MLHNFYGVLGTWIFFSEHETKITGVWQRIGGLNKLVGDEAKPEKQKKPRAPRAKKHFSTENTERKRTFQKQKLGGMSPTESFLVLKRKLYSDESVGGKQEPRPVRSMEGQQERHPVGSEGGQQELRPVRSMESEESSDQPDGPSKMRAPFTTTAAAASQIGGLNTLEGDEAKPEKQKKPRASRAQKHFSTEIAEKKRTFQKKKLGGMSPAESFLVLKRKLWSDNSAGGKQEPRPVGSMKDQQERHPVSSEKGQQALRHSVGSEGGQQERRPVRSVESEESSDQSDGPSKMRAHFTTTAAAASQIGGLNKQEGDKAKSEKPKKPQAPRAKKHLSTENPERKRTFPKKKRKLCSDDSVGGKQEPRPVGSMEDQQERQPVGSEGGQQELRPVENVESEESSDQSDGPSKTRGHFTTTAAAASQAVVRSEEEAAPLMSFRSATRPTMEPFLIKKPKIAKKHTDDSQKLERVCKVCVQTAMELISSLLDSAKRGSACWCSHVGDGTCDHTEWETAPQDNDEDDENGQDHGFDEEYNDDEHDDEEEDYEPPSYFKFPVVPDDAEEPAASLCDPQNVTYDPSHRFDGDLIQSLVTGLRSPVEKNQKKRSSSSPVADSISDHDTASEQNELVIPKLHVLEISAAIDESYQAMGDYPDSNPKKKPRPSRSIPKEQRVLIKSCFERNQGATIKELENELENVGLKITPIIHRRVQETYRHLQKKEEERRNANPVSTEETLSEVEEKRKAKPVSTEETLL